MATGVATWSQTAASNATADGNVNLAEGMAASQLNDSGRAMMASVAKYRDDQTGVAASGGPTNYTASSNQGFASLAAMSLQTITVQFNVTNAANPTLNVDGLGAKAIYFDNGTTPVGANSLIAGSTYTLTYNNALPGWTIHSLSPASVLPPGVMMPYGGSSAPTGWLLCDGSAVSRTTFAALFAAISTSFGIGDGSTTFNVPNTADKVLAGKGSGSILSFSGTVGSTGGEANHTLTTGELPSFTPSGTIGGSQTFSNVLTSSGGQNVGSASTPAVNVPGSITVNGSNFSFTGNAIGGGSAHNNVQPTLIVNHIIKT